MKVWETANKEKRKIQIKAWEEKHKDALLERHKVQRVLPAKFNTLVVTELIKYYKEYSITVEYGVEYVLFPCQNCGDLFKPTNRQVSSRLAAINGKLTGECHLYCSDTCKTACPIFKKQKYSSDHPKYRSVPSRTDQPALKELCLERDGYACIRCGATEELELQHLTGVELNPIESADLDNCVILCKSCHAEIHKYEGCRYSDLRRKPCKI